jgi:hypothetical protein
MDKCQKTEDNWRKAKDTKFKPMLMYSVKQYTMRDIAEMSHEELEEKLKEDKKIPTFENKLVTMLSK